MLVFDAGLSLRRGTLIELNHVFHNCFINWLFDYSFTLIGMFCFHETEFAHLKRTFMRTPVMRTLTESQDNYIFCI